MEKKFHELTSELIPEKATAYVIKKSLTDSIIRKWLSEKSKAINADANAERTVDEILGLTDEPEKKTIMICSQHLTEDCELCGGSKKTPQKQSWCEHFKWMQCPMVGWHFRRNESETWQWVQQEFTKYPCPICGTPRPTPTPLVERVATVMWECSTKTTTFDNADQRVRGDWLKEAQAALDFLREHKEEL